MISIIAAIGKNKELGKDNKLLWNIPEDMKWFRDKTRGHPVIMGRKTYESIGRPLPGRLNVIITRNNSYSAPGCMITHSLEEAIKNAQKKDKDEVFIIGGGEIYKQALAYADRLYLTIVDREFDADTYFPDYSEFSKQVFKKESSNEKYKYTFYILERQSS